MIRVTILGKDGTEKLFSELPKRLALALFRSMQDSAILIQSLAKVKAPVARGALRISIAQSVGLEDGHLVGRVGSGLPYAGVIERNRRPGTFPNVGELKLWVKRRLRISKESQVSRIAFLIGRAIKRRGFKDPGKLKYLTPAFEEAEPRVRLIFAGRITQAIGDLGGSS